MITNDGSLANRANMTSLITRGEHGTRNVTKLKAYHHLVPNLLFRPSKPQV
jgi:hypothetical protein